MKRIARFIAPAALAFVAVGANAAELTAADTAPVAASSKAFERVGPQPAFGAVAPGDIGLKPVERASKAAAPAGEGVRASKPRGPETVVGA